MQELRSVTSYALRVMKVMAQALGRAIVQECHLWLNLSEKILDATISQGGLFGDTVEDSQQFSVLKK